MATLKVNGKLVTLVAPAPGDTPIQLAWQDKDYIQPLKTRTVPKSSLGLSSEGSVEQSSEGTYTVPGLIHCPLANNTTFFGTPDPAAIRQLLNLGSYRMAFLGADGYIYQQTLPRAQFNMPYGYTGGIHYITSKEVEGFRITITVPGLYEVSSSTGYLGTKVSIAVFYRIYDPTQPNAPWSVSDRNFTVSGATRTELVKWWEEECELGRYEILLVRNTEDHSSSFSLIDTVYLKEITEITYRKLRYNHTALLGVKIRATDQLSGPPPTITSLVKGLKVAVPSNCETGGQYSRAYATAWDGKLAATKVWTDNPVWCLYDLLTNSRYGMADYYKIDPDKHGLMLANFYIMAKYCDESITYVDADGQSKTRPRFALNIVLDQSKSAAEWIATIASVMRATVYYNEGIVWIDIDRPKYVSQIFTMSSITEYTQTGTSYRSIPNTYEVQWFNPDTGYEVDVFRVEDVEVQLNQHIEERKKALMLLGVTNFDQAKSLAKFALLAGKHRTKLITFKTGTQGLRAMVSDVIGIQHDVPKWGWGGKITGVTVNAKGNFVLGLSSAVESASPVQMLLQYAPSTDRVERLPIHPVVITMAASTEVIVSPNYTSQDGTARTLEPRVGDTYLFNLATNAISTFKITSIKRDSDEVVEISAVEYDEQIYSQADDTSSLGAWVTRNYSITTNPVRSSVTGVYVNQKTYQDSSGAWKVGVEVFYDPPAATFANGSSAIATSSFWKGARLHYSSDGVNFTDLPAVDTTGRFFIPELTESGDYTFVVTSVYLSGQQSITDAFSDGEAHPYSYQRIDLYVPNDSFMQGVTGLAIENRANDGTFLGKDCVITWRAPLAVDAAAGSTAEAAGSTATSQWLRHYTVEFKGADGLTRRTINTTETRYIYTYEMNHADADLNREFTVTVTAVDRVGRVSNPSTITCKNPAPKALD